MSSVFPGHNLPPLDQEKDPATADGVPPKRRRGRPRKDDVQGLSPTVSRRSSSVPFNPAQISSDELIGKQIHGVLDGIFDAGYLLTAQVGHDGPMLSGMVFNPSQAVPITPENDIAPHLPMCRRGEVRLQETPTPPSSSNLSHPARKKAKSIEPSQTWESSRGVLASHAVGSSASNAKKGMLDDVSHGLQNVPVVLQDSGSNSSQAILEAVGAATVTPLTTFAPSQTQTYDVRVGISGPSAAVIDVQNVNSQPAVEAPKGTEDVHEVGGTSTLTVTDNSNKNMMNDETAAGLPDSAAQTDKIEVASNDVCIGSKSPTASKASATQAMETNPEQQQVHEKSQLPSGNQMPANDVCSESKSPIVSAAPASPATQALEANPKQQQVNETSQLPSGNQMPSDHTLEH